MKKILILLILLGGLIGVAVVSKKSKTQRLAVAATREKLLDKLDASAIRKIRLKDGDKTVTLAAVGEEWTVAERSGYPAAFSKITKSIQDLMDQKVGKKLSIGKSVWGEVKLLTPGDGDAAKAGFVVELLGDNDKPLKTLVLGESAKVSKVGAPASPFGDSSNSRLVRLTDDGDTVWEVANQFYDLQAKPEEWIDKSFIEVQKIKTIEVTAPAADDSWKASRKTETETEFALENGKPGESLDNIKAGLTNLLSNPTFNDVLPKDQATADFMKGATQVKISTFDGFNYTLKVLTKGEKGSEKYYLTVEATGDVPKERPAVKDEKPEDKKKADEEFATKKKTLEDRLAKAKKSAGWVYEVSSYALGSLVKKKSEVLKDAPVAGETDKDGNVKVKGTATPATPGLPPAHPPISVTTPPVAAPVPPPALPSVPKMEVKPSAPDAPSVTPPAPAPAAPTPATPAPSATPAPAPSATPAPATPPAAPKEEPKPAPAPAPATPPAEPAK
ncbi:MAG: hypothetical protein JWO89_3558 [Verrucomicrobiaceae bacterium]|nr:hypothetical protein [Verrucomicrobiaceae bacterium]